MKVDSQQCKKKYQQLLANRGNDQVGTIAEHSYGGMH